MNNELLAMVEYIKEERGVDREVLLEAIETALMSASKKSIHPANDLEVKIDRKTGDIQAWARLEVVDGIPNNDQITLERARQKLPEVQVGEIIAWEVTPKNFGRIAAQTAKQAIMQQLRRVEKENVKEEFAAQIGSLVNGVVRRFDNGGIIVDLQRAEGFIPPGGKIRGERYQVGDRINALLTRIEDVGSGPSVILSRTDPQFVVKLFEREVSEIHDGIVSIKSIARDSGVRVKVAVDSDDPRVDPVGSCVGIRGMRVKNITAELGGERIDIIRYDSDLRAFAANALQPAKPGKIELTEDGKLLRAHVVADQSRLAFGRGGQNVKLASRLVGVKVEIVTENEERGESFEEKLDKAVVALSEKLGISPETAKILVNNGYLSVEGLKAATSEDIQGIEGISEEEAEAIVEKLPECEE